MTANWGNQTCCEARGNTMRTLYFFYSRTIRSWVSVVVDRKGSRGCGSLRNTRSINIRLAFLNSPKLMSKKRHFVLKMRSEFARSQIGDVLEGGDETIRYPEAEWGINRSKCFVEMSYTRQII